MLSSKRLSRRLALLGLCIALAGCGFAPVYTNNGAVLLFGGVSIEAPDTVAGYRLREHLVARIGEGNGGFGLRISLETNEQPLGVTSEQTTTRYNLNGVAQWELRDLATGENIGQGQVDTFTSYSTTGTTVATRAAARDAEARLSVALADLIAARLQLLSAAR